MYLGVYTTTASILGSLWIIFKYLQQPKDNIGLLLIFVLAVSDCVFAFSILAYHLFVDETAFQDAIFIFSMQFSIMWASAVSYIVCKSLQNPALDIMRLFKTILGVIILISTATTIL